MKPAPDAQPARPSDPPRRDARGSEPHQQLLDELQQALTLQLSLAGQDDLDGVHALTDRVDALLGQLTRLAGAAEHIDRARLERIRHLHSTLRLSLATRKEDLGGKLSQARRGKTALRAYGGRGRLNHNWGGDIRRTGSKVGLALCRYICGHPHGG